MSDKDVKTFCWKPWGECNIIKTGFHLEQFFVCTTCKSEVSEGLKDLKEAAEPKKKEPEPDQDDIDYWTTGGWNPMGDDR